MTPTVRRAKNILFITSDEMRGDVQGYSGNPDVQTPNLDALAARGCVFARHFAPFPKCVPSRCSMHTGRYTHTDGLRSVMGPNHLPKGTPTLAGLLRERGYETAVLGLNHVWEDPWFYGEGDQRNEKGVGITDYQSFTKGRLADLAMQSRTYPEGTRASGPHIDALAQIDYKGLVAGESGRQFSDENRTDQAICYLRELRDRSKPFFLQLNLSKPHPPYGIHEPWYSMYDRQEITAFPYALPENAALPLRAMREHRLGFDVPEGSLRELQAVYYGMVSFIDDLVGRVIRCLDDEGLAEDTLIVFTADHGDFAGQYGLNEKWDAALQDCLLHVPCIVAGPGIPAGHRVDGLSEHVDFPATLLDYLGMQAPQEWVWHGSRSSPAPSAARPSSPTAATRRPCATASAARPSRRRTAGRSRPPAASSSPMARSPTPCRGARWSAPRTGSWSSARRAAMNSSTCALIATRCATSTAARSTRGSSPT